jgi:hypothetical protein
MSCEYNTNHRNALTKKTPKCPFKKKLAERVAMDSSLTTAAASADSSLVITASYQEGKKQTDSKSWRKR